MTLPGGGYQILREYNPTSENSVQGRVMVVDGVMHRRPETHQYSRKHRRGMRGP